ncbi:MAG: tRNA threonylcarbamoyladenosine dehydratase [Longibaculum muris]|uniref:tRNA A37 threonylcarbamoyladenosine dehydratase n=1 Tax=Longibaculum muris TaxID=1796628 RepID=A0A4R3Z8S0_9FIRM|nr:tRNA threonylcarbamoyladenosine dehydratase [Longibaculum muris]MBS5369589.1 tRNA threonylcarbamoyladenosine dehydratase [Coprobacillus cateniformis]MCR1887545.1 tRNA threonylcarbamoyladenosine dehydratase [Longibaculum muris]MED9811737.1 tRNA threonylcarbamoyladenosine dehydratase [Longibaculum muris]TCW00738.1 tRNA A37 threonylcarbamoyladenosine dehydratase [Longibaculum muris]
MFSRFELLIGEEKLQQLQNSHVLVFGVGGVGGYVVEALVRSGIGHITIVDNDEVSLTNLNRQIIATRETIGKKKVEVMKERILSINPDCLVTGLEMFYLPENADTIDLTKYDYVVDAIDTITSKIELAMRCEKLNVPLISSMGTGNKLNPAMLEVSDIYKTSVCPLAKVMRKELKTRGVKHLKVVYSKELPIKPRQSNEPTNKRTVPGSSAFVPSSAGLLIASEVIKDLLK